MADQYDLLVKGFETAIHQYPVSVVEALSPDTALLSGQRAARYAVAPGLWRRVLGEYLESADVVSLLGVTRQAISKRLAAGSLIGLRGPGTTHFPAWQFDLENGRVRPEVRDVTAVFMEELGRIDPYVIASWAATRQHEDLDAQTPAEWIDSGGDRERLIEAARRIAGRLAS